jgi:hypothetical protein
MGQQWYLARDKTKDGPFSPSQLKGFAATGCLQYSGPQKLDHQLSYCGGPGKG